jgi:hypothetical protein
MRFILVMFQVLTAASMKFSIVFWDVLPCKIIVDQRFRGTFCLHHQGDSYFILSISYSGDQIKDGEIGGTGEVW